AAVADRDVIHPTGDVHAPDDDGVEADHEATNPTRRLWLAGMVWICLATASGSRAPVTLIVTPPAEAPALTARPPTTPRAPKTAGAAPVTGGATARPVT